MQFRENIHMITANTTGYTVCYYMCHQNTVERHLSDCCFSVPSNIQNDAQILLKGNS